MPKGRPLLKLTAPGAATRLRWLLAFVLFMMTFYFGLRFIFFAFNFRSFASLPVENILLAFVHGARFDLATVIVTNAPFMALGILPLPLLAQRWARLLWFFLLLINVPLAVLSLGDT